MANTALPLMIMAAITFFSAMSSLTEAHWAETVDAKKEATLTSTEKVTTLQFYFHDTLSGKNPSAVRVAEAANTKTSPTLFGAVLMADDPLTETPDPKSKLVGRAQGLYGASGQQQLSLIMAMSFAFTEGPYNGSTVSVNGQNPAMNPVRELPVVGGTGIFRMARGYAIAKTHWFDPASGDAIVGYNVTLIH